MARMVINPNQCLECATGTRRKVGPDGLCASHRRARAAAQKARRAENHVRRVYSLPEGAYEALKALQGGRCAICQWATGRTKRLAVDHDHGCCAGRTSCGACIRGLLCGPCNRMLGHVRDSPQALRRAADYLENPPGKGFVVAWGAAA
jgi:hypothetical protein